MRSWLDRLVCNLATDWKLCFQLVLQIQWGQDPKKAKISSSNFPKLLLQHSSGLFFTALKVLTYLILESYGLYRLAVRMSQLISFARNLKRNGYKRLKTQGKYERMPNYNWPSTWQKSRDLTSDPLP